MSRIAIIGTGISGLGAAFLLHETNDITVYEKADYVGGHTRTRTVSYQGKDINVDTGFIVFNYRNYPKLASLFKYLKVPVHKSVMSFGVTTPDHALEWSAESPNALFGQRRNLFRPKFYRFLLDVLKFNRVAVKSVQRWPDLTMGALLQKLRLSDWFTRYYILPMGGAIWSCSLDAILSFPAKAFVDFFEAHGLLTVTQQPQWYTVTGGSQEYVRRLTKSFQDRIRLQNGAARVTRQDNKILVVDEAGNSETFDEVIFACHANEALKLLSDPRPDEKELLGSFSYQTNKVVLHRDESIMPTERRCWASWIYHAGLAGSEAPVAVTYWMNRLQGIPDTHPLFVTLNPISSIDSAKIFDSHVFEHPVYSAKAVKAQSRLSALQGLQHTWYCGAYHKNGFHEDGFASAVLVAERLGASLPW